MKPLLSSVVFSALLFSYSCGKDEVTEGPVTVSGQVTSRYVAKPIPFATVFLKRLNKEDVGALAMQELDAKQADEQGNYEFNFNAEKNYNYYVSAAESINYFASVDEKLNFKKGSTARQDISQSPFGWVRFDLINEAPKDRIDLIINHFNMNLYGLLNDTSVYINYIGGEDKDVYWAIRINGNETIYHDTIQFPPLDTANYVIRY